MKEKEMVKSILVKQLGVDEKMIFESEFDNLSLIKKGILDSLKFLELISSIEEKFNMVIENDELLPNNFDSISKILNFIKNKQQ